MGEVKTHEEQPLNQKYLLTITEASRYFGVGMTKLNSLARDPACPFVFRNGCKKMIKREMFEKYISENKSI